MKMEESKAAVVVVILLIIVGIIAFWGGAMFQRVHSVGGLYYSRSNYMNGFGGGRQMMGQPPMGGFGMRNGSVSSGRGIFNGTITNVSGNQIAIKFPNGTTGTVNLSSSTQYLQISTATQTSLSQGQSITVTGQLSQDGALSAQTVNINPAQ